jgi:hypothetical protein
MGNYWNLTLHKFLEHFDLYNETNMLVFIDQLKMLQMFLERSLNIMWTKKNSTQKIYTFGMQILISYTSSICNCYILHIIHE